MGRVAAAVIEREGKILIARRKAEGRFGGLWEFPGGKIEPGETPEACLQRELREELGVEAKVKEFLGTSRHDYSDFEVELLVFRVEILTEGFRLNDHDEIRWVLPEELKHYAFPEADGPFARDLASRTRSAVRSRRP